jgi:hypothetical protein
MLDKPNTQKIKNIGMHYIAHYQWIYIYLSHFLLSKAAIKIFCLISSCCRFVHEILLIRNQMIDKLSKNRFKNKCNNTGNNAYLMMFVLLLRVLKCKTA